MEYGVDNSGGDGRGEDAGVGICWAVEAAQGNSSGETKDDDEEADEDVGDNKCDMIEDVVEGHVGWWSTVIVVSKPLVSRLQS